MKEVLVVVRLDDIENDGREYEVFYLIREDQAEDFVKLVRSVRRLVWRTQKGPYDRNTIRRLDELGFVPIEAKYV